MQRIPGLYIAKTRKKGRGVYCLEDILKDSLIEICPVLVIPAKEVDIIHHTELHDYYFIWGDHDDQAAIALGYGSLYNHSYRPNADYIYDLDHDAIEIHAIRNIPAGREITINYNGDPGCRDALWFDKEGQRIMRHKIKPKAITGH